MCPTTYQSILPFGLPLLGGSGRGELGGLLSVRHLGLQQGVVGVGSCSCSLFLVLLLQLLCLRCLCLRCLVLCLCWVALCLCLYLGGCQASRWLFIIGNTFLFIRCAELRSYHRCEKVGDFQGSFNLPKNDLEVVFGFPKDTDYAPL